MKAAFAVNGNGEYQYWLNEIIMLSHDSHAAVVSAPH